MKNIIYFLICFAFSSNILEAQRNVAWLHGLGGTTDSWNVYETHYNNIYNLNSTSIGYAMDGIKKGGNEVKEKLENQWGNGNNQNMIISHSMGGLVTRSIDQTQDGLYGGFITVGTPHGGAPLSAAFNNGDLQDYVNDACINLVKGPDKALACTLGAYYTAPMWQYGITPNSLCNMAWQAALNQFGAFNNPSSKDLAPGSDFLEGLNNPSNAIRLGFHGIENKNIHWRVFTSLLKNKPSQLNLNQKKDQDYLATANKALIFYETASDALHTTATMLYMIPFGAFSGKAACFRDAAFKFSDGANWIRRSEGGWIKLIGAGSYRQSGTISRIVGMDCDGDGKVDEYDGPRPPRHEDPNPDNCSPCHPVYANVPIYEWESEDSDGIVPVSKAQCPGAVDNLEVEGANHQELLNHPRMTARFRQTFNGVHHPFFKMKN